MRAAQITSILLLTKSQSSSLLLLLTMNKLWFLSLTSHSLLFCFFVFLFFVLFFCCCLFVCLLLFLYRNDCDYFNSYNNILINAFSAPDNVQLRTDLNVDTQIRDPCVILIHTYFQNSRRLFSASMKQDRYGSEHKTLLA